MFYKLCKIYIYTWYEKQIIRIDLNTTAWRTTYFNTAEYDILLNGNLFFFNWFQYILFVQRIEYFADQTVSGITVETQYGEVQSQGLKKNTCYILTSVILRRIEQQKPVITLVYYLKFISLYSEKCKVFVVHRIPSFSQYSSLHFMLLVGQQLQFHVRIASARIFVFRC